MKEFVSLTDVKINGEYTYLKDRAPLITDVNPPYINGDTWLDIVTGYSYILIDQTAGTWQRIEEAFDYKVELRKDEVFKNVINYLSNIFAIDRNKIYLDTDNYSADFPNGFPVGWTRSDAFPLIQYEGVFSYWQFNAVDSETFEITALIDVYGSIEDSFKIGDTIFIEGSRRNDGYFTITDIDTVNNKISVFEEIEDGTANAYIYLCNVPNSIIQIAADMVYYDLTVRNKTAGLKS